MWEHSVDNKQVYETFQELHKDVEMDLPNKFKHGVDGNQGKDYGIEQGS